RIRFANRCGICSEKDLPQRAAYIKCGHVVCLPCAQRNQRGNPTNHTCPFCRGPGEFVRLFEVTETEKSVVEYSRDCAVCLDDSPAERAAYTNCGHILCFSCAQQIRRAKRNRRRNLTCPFCRG
ncbi:hypothetical protein PFISCL1PPCAC_2757, partial [Pristionchus fissidentatus]